MSKKEIYKDLRRNWKFESDLWEAIRSLASNSDNIKKRLGRAYDYRIQYLEPAAIPQERNQKKLTQIKNKLTKNHTKPVEEAITYLPLKSCRKMVSDLCDIYSDFIHFEWNQNL
jgi:Mg2+ and Co2+ transporter CorA